MRKTLGWISAAVLGLALLAPPASAQDPGKEVLQLHLPKPMFVGTPKNIRTPNLETITGKPRGPFMVPAGTKLLSFPSTGASSPPTGWFGIPLYPPKRSAAALGPITASELSFDLFKAAVRLRS